MEDDLVCSVQNFSLWKSCERSATRQGYCPVIVYPGQAGQSPSPGAQSWPLSHPVSQPCVPGPGRSERSTVDCEAQSGTNQRPGGHEPTNEEPAVTREGLAWAEGQQCCRVRSSPAESTWLPTSTSSAEKNIVKGKSLEQSFRR